MKCSAVNGQEALQHGQATKVSVKNVDQRPRPWL